MAARHPIYATADMVVESRDVPHETIVAEIIEALARSPALGATPGRCRRGIMSTGHEQAVRAPGAPLPAGVASIRRVGRTLLRGADRPRPAGAAPPS